MPTPNLSAGFAKQLREFVAELRARIRRDLEAGIEAIAASTIADAVALEVPSRGSAALWAIYGIS